MNQIKQTKHRGLYSYATFVFFIRSGFITYIFVCPFQICNDLTTENLVQCLAVVAVFAMS